METSVMDVSEDKLFNCDNTEDSDSTNVKVVKRRSAVERQLETNLTTKITSLTNDLISPNTSRYGRTRKSKTNEDFYVTAKEVAKAMKSPPLSDKKGSMSPTALKMYAAKSPLKSMSPQNNIAKKYGSQLPNKLPIKIDVFNMNAKFTNGHSENIPNQIENNEKQMKVYVRKDLIQKGPSSEKTSSLMKNMFSPPKSMSLNGSITSPIFDNYSVANGDCNRDLSPKTKHAFSEHSGSVVKALNFTSSMSENKKTILESSTFIKKTTNMDNVITERLDEELCPWKDGDVTWARIGSHPFWPCLITRDPYSKKYLKRKSLGRSTNVTYVLHVTFFGDNGRRGWVMSNMLMKFEGLEGFRAQKEQITSEHRKKDPKYYNAFSVSQNKLRKWNEAVNEAEMIVRRPAEYRVDFFNDLFSKPNEKIGESETPKKESKKKSKTEHTNVSLSESLFDSLFASENEISVSEKVKNKSRNNSFDVSDVVTACIDDIATKAGNRKIQRQSHMDRWLQKAKSPTKASNNTKKTIKTNPQKKLSKSKSESIRGVKKNLSTAMNSGKNESNSSITISDLVKQFDESNKRDSEKEQKCSDNENSTQNNDEKVKNNVAGDSMEVEYVNNLKLVLQSDNKDKKNDGDDKKYVQDIVKNNSPGVMEIESVNNSQLPLQSDNEDEKKSQNNDGYDEQSVADNVKTHESDVIEMDDITDCKLLFQSENKDEKKSQYNDGDVKNENEDNLKISEIDVMEVDIVNDGNDEELKNNTKNIETDEFVNQDEPANKSDNKDESKTSHGRKIISDDSDTIEKIDKNYETETKRDNDKSDKTIKINGVVDSNYVFKDSKSESNILCDSDVENGVDKKEIDAETSNDSVRSLSPKVQLNTNPLSQENGNANSLTDRNEVDNSIKVLRSRKTTLSPKELIDPIANEEKDVTTPSGEKIYLDSIKKVLRSRHNGQKSADDSYNEENHTETTSTESESEKEISPKKAVLSKSKFDDADFQHFLNLRRDGLMDENPDLNEDDLISYLYKTWLYEENLKTDEMKNDDTQQLVKGLGEENLLQPKKKRKPRANVENDIEKTNELCIPRDKPARKRIVKNYVNDSETSDEELDIKPEKDDVLNTTIEKAIIIKKSSPSSENSIKLYFSPELKKPLESNNDIEAVLDTEADEPDFYMESLNLTKPKPNLFKGLVKERVCEICETSGNLVKCKGSCGGVFHIDCCKKLVNSPSKEVESTQKKRRGKNKRKYKRSHRKSEENDESQSDFNMTLDNTPETFNIAKIINGDTQEENTSPSRRMSLTANALEFESQTAIKMQEIMTETKYDTSDMDMLDSTEDECDWDQMEAGKCEIVDVKLKKKNNVQEIQDKSDLEKEIETFKCNTCDIQNIPPCFVCKKTNAPKTDSEIRQKCSISHCSKMYHLECLNMWPQTKFNSGAPSKNNRKISVHYETITCPRHVCHTCVSDDPRGCKTRFSADKLAKCVRCPATYHSFTQCLPAGSQVLTASQIVCPRHYERRPGKIPFHVNTAWCFICASGGTLICCETCPTSFHAECLNISPPEDGYICEDCETGRLPLYGEMVWVKLGNYRWWPGLVLHPHEIPKNIMSLKHVLGEFVVRFFGALDHYWVNRGRVFPYQEGDTGHASTKKSAVDSSFIRAIQQAAQAFTIIQKHKQSSAETSDITSSLLPPHYVKLKVNKPCGTLAAGRRADIEADSMTQCDCNPDVDQPCGPESDCLNRMLLTECGGGCASGDRCHNRMFEKRQYPFLTPYRTPHRGWGLQTLQEVKQGQFVIEYVGEVIDMAEFRRRMKRKYETKDENYYFLTLDKDRMIDAGPKGNVARFMNHCCEPNCETQKWTVNGDVRVGLFAIKNIPANTEVTFNYNLECAGVDKKPCLCGAPRCSGYIGAKLKDDPEIEKKKQKKLEQQQLKRKNKKKNSMTNSPSTSKKVKQEKNTSQKLSDHVTRDDIPITSSPIIKNKEKTVVKVMSKEMLEIEKDLQIIREATNLINSTESEIEIENSNKNHVKSALKNTSLNESDLRSNSLKRKRVSFSSEEIIIYGSEINTVKSPQVKILRLQNSDKNGSVRENIDLINGHINGDSIIQLQNGEEIVKKGKGRSRKSLPPTITA